MRINTCDATKERFRFLGLILVLITAAGSHRPFHKIRVLQRKSIINNTQGTVFI